MKVVRDMEQSLAKHATAACKGTKVAIMGCVVNGPGEAKEADIGVAFGKNEGLLFKNGKPVRKISFDACTRVLIEELTRHGKRS